MVVLVLILNDPNVLKEYFDQVVTTIIFLQLVQMIGLF